MTTRLAALGLLAPVWGLLGLVGDGSTRAAAPTASSAGQLAHAAAALGGFAGETSQGRRITIQVNDGAAAGLTINDAPSAVFAVNFSIVYRCTRASHVSLRVNVLRPVDAWQIEDAGGRGFSDWFSGPIGHDFHIIGTFTQDGRAVSGTLHSLLVSTRRGRCDSGRVSFQASLVRPPVSPPSSGAITLAQYRSVQLGTTARAVVAFIGLPADRETFAPADFVEHPIALNGSLLYTRRDHPHQVLGFIVRGGRVVSRGE